jgi:hypothetical protein
MNLAQSGFHRLLSNEHVSLAAGAPDGAHRHLRSAGRAGLHGGQYRWWGVTLLDGYWIPTHRADPRAFALYRRHYSAKKNFSQRRPGNFNIVGPAFHIVLLTVDCQALFVWIKNNMERFDRQVGVCCTIFRNETDTPHILSSDLIREADQLADGRWPGERHFTYVDAAETARRRSKHAQPGKCFLEAGWQSVGWNKTGKLVLLEKPPVADY